MAAKQEFRDWWSKNFALTCIDSPEGEAALAAWNHVEEKFTSTNSKNAPCSRCTSRNDQCHCGECRWNYASQFVRE
jgi:hypothetical protein